MFESRAELTRDWLLTLLTNIRFGFEALRGTNVLAYFNGAEGTYTSVHLKGAPLQNKLLT